MIGSASHLREAYEHRVKQVADQIIDLYQGKPVTKKELILSIKARMVNIPLGSLKPDEFVKDVIRMLGSQIQVSREKSETTLALEALIEQITHHVSFQISNSLPDVEILDLSYNSWIKYKSTLQRIFWNLAVSNRMDMYTWWNNQVWPQVEREFKKQMGSTITVYVADAYDQIKDDLAHDAAHKGVEVESYLNQHGISLDNPYRN